MFKRAQRLIAAVTFTLGVAQPAWATVQIVPPGDDVAGQSQLYWAQAWWQWALGIPAIINPLTDTTGQYGAVNNGGPVFFLAAFISVNGSGGPNMDTVSRTITVPAGKPVFFPVINSFYVPISLTGTYDASPCKDPLTLGCAIQSTSFTQAENMAVQLDGAPLLDNTQIEQYRQTSASYFSVALPLDNVLGVTPIVNYDQCVSLTGVSCTQLWTQDGFYIALDDLSVGIHVLHFAGEGQSLAGGAIGLDVTDTLIVTVPEPSTWALMLLGFAALGFAAYRTRRTQRSSIPFCPIPTTPTTT